MSNESDSNSGSEDLNQSAHEALTESRNKLILFILNNIQSKLPIKQSELSEVAGKKLYKEAFAKAITCLLKTYGIHVKEVPDSKSQVKFICYSRSPACSLQEYDEQQSRHLTLAFLIASYIYMCDAAVEESQLENFLEALEIPLTNNHPYFGENLKKLVTETFVRQLYLKREKSESTFNKETIYLYSLGYRSLVEFEKRAMLETTAKILGKPSKMFVSQYHKAYEMETHELDD